ncbi:MAG: stage II sporulation protein D [Clostridia bacterium]|nr:stage II sporulation protein D [Clostridia bacterium]
MKSLKWYPVLYVACFCLIPYLLNAPRFNEPAKQSPAGKDFTITLLRTESGKVETIPFKEYLCGVVSAEMQANFEQEALKAQTVAACSYSLYRYEYLKKYPNAETGHPEAYVCDDHTHCKSYLTAKEAKKRWGAEWYNKYYGNILSAVEQVYGQVITYDGEIINAVFHAISSGRTESAESVWGTPIPYLVSVDSSVDTAASGYETTVSFTLEETRQRLKQLGITVGDDPKKWFDLPLLGSAGSVESVTVGGVSVKGTELRKAFDLRSTAFAINVQNDRIVFTVHGYGHQVGMSQHGANQLAKAGKSYT